MFFRKFKLSKKFLGDFSLTQQRILWLSILMVGITLRMIWGEDIEFKGDEAFNYNVAILFGMPSQLPTVGEVFNFPIPLMSKWPVIGSTSGVLLPNPSFSTWIFGFLAWAFAVENPEDMGRAVQACNALAIALLGVFAWRNKETQHRETWLWVFALAAVSPLDIILQRKIWAQSLLPPLTMLMTIGWWQKDKKWGAFVYGFMGALLGQLHMSGFIFAFAWLISTWTWHRKQTHWRAWFAGSSVGAVLLIPWIFFIYQRSDTLTHVSAFFGGYADFARKFHPFTGWMNVRLLQYWLIWFSGELGLGLDYSLHHEITRFLAWPWFNEASGGTYLMGAAFTGIFLLSLGVLGGSSFGLVKSILHKGFKKVLLPSSDPKDLTQVSLLAGFSVYGLLLMVIPIFIHRHYLVILFGFSHLAMVQLVSYASVNLGASAISIKRGLLTSLVTLQLALSVGFLTYIHAHGGAPNGDYGVALSHQNSLQK